MSRRGPHDEVGPSTHGARSLADALGGHQNSLGLIRLVLASVVIFHHAFLLGGYGPDPGLAQTGGQASVGSLAVAGFFAISGYLIAKSGMSADVLQYFWRRALRIFPAFWAVLLLTALVIGPLLWVAAGHPFGTYFSLAPENPFSYLAANWRLTIGSFGIYDLLATTTPYGLQVGASILNGSIWTLIYEWNCYLLIGVAVAFGVLSKARILVPVAAGLLLIVQVVGLVNPAAPGAIAPFLADPHRVSLTFTFMLGASLAVYSKRVVYSDQLGVLAGLVVLLTLRYGGFLTLGTIAGTYFVMYLAARLPRTVQWIGAKNDYSYGVYIYGFLVQQVLAFFGWHTLGFVPYVAAALLISYALAWLSWHGVEKRAMTLKDWGPGQGWRHWLARLQRWRKPDSSAGDVTDLGAKLSGTA